MKSRISFFNRAAFRKDITRFAPLWVLYTIAILLIMITTVANTYREHPVDSLNAMLYGFSGINFIYGALAAALLFGDLFQGKMCNALHAMPIRREAWFGSKILAGLAFSLIPNLLTALVAMPYLRVYWFACLLWMCGATLQYVFYFGLAVLAIFCVGNRFAFATVYAILNFASLVLLWLLEIVYLPMMPGVQLDTSRFFLFCPAIQSLNNVVYMQSDWRYRDGLDAMWTAEFIMGDGWNYLLICAGIGIALMAVALMLYRRRNLESAGDFMAVKVLRPVFLVLYTLCAGAFLSLFGELFAMDASILFLVVGLIVGFFTGKMLLERTGKVFQKKSFLQLGILTLAMLLSLWLVKMDVFGVVQYVPDTEEIASVEVTHRTGDHYRVTVTAPEEIEKVCQAHELAVANVCGGVNCGYAHVQFKLTYNMKDGRKVSRNYSIHVGSQVDQILDEVMK